MRVKWTLKALETYLPHAGIQFVVYEDDDDLGSIIDRFDCYETSPESVDAVIHRDYRYADQLGRGIPLVIRKIQKLPGFKFHLQEYDEAFSASVEFPFL